MCVILVKENNKYKIVYKGRLVGIGIYEKSTPIKTFFSKKSAVNCAENNYIKIENVDMVH